MKTRKGAASIYIVIFTTTLLGIIALSFVRIMLAESLRTTNYSLSQSAYNSALAGVEDAKIVLLRYQNCMNKGSYLSSNGKIGNCSSYQELFKDEDAANTTAQKCNVVGGLLHGTDESAEETPVQTREGVDTGTIDQAYTCVKIAAYTEDFLATLNSKNPTKLIPLRSSSSDEQNKINRIQIQWFDDQDYDNVTNDVDGASVIKDGYAGFWKRGRGSDLTGTILSNKGDYSKQTASQLGNGFTEETLVPPVIQVTAIQTSNAFTMDQFYASAGIGDDSKTNRGTLMLRPTSGTDDLKDKRKIISGTNSSNVLPANSLAYSANKSYNTPMDVVCNPGEASWGTYACAADFYLPKPIGDGSRNIATSFLVVNLPYGGPQTDISVKMYSCQDKEKPINAKVGTDNTTNCRIIYFAGVQPMVDSTGRANDLFRRVESRIELADTNFPIANYALAMTDPDNEAGITKDFYVTKGCSYSSSRFDGTDVVNVNGRKASDIGSNPATGDGSVSQNMKTCANARSNSGSGKGNGE